MLASCPGTSRIIRFLSKIMQSRHSLTFKFAFSDKKQMSITEDGESLMLQARSLQKDLGLGLGLSLGQDKGSGVVCCDPVGPADPVSLYVLQ